MGAVDLDPEFLVFSEPVWFRVEVGERNLIIRKFSVIKHTEKGVWLQMFGDSRRFVLREYQHRARAFAAPTLAQAREDFRLRKCFHIKMLKLRIEAAERALTLLSDQRYFEEFG